MAQCHKAAHLAMEEVGVQAQIPAGQLAVFFFHLSLTLWLVSVNCILLTFARVLRKRISSTYKNCTHSMREFKTNVGRVCSNRHLHITSH